MVQLAMHVLVLQYLWTSIFASNSDSRCLIMVQVSHYLSQCLTLNYSCKLFTLTQREDKHHSKSNRHKNPTSDTHNPQIIETVWKTKVILNTHHSKVRCVSLNKQKHECWEHAWKEQLYGLLLMEHQVVWYMSDCTLPTTTWNQMKWIPKFQRVFCS